MLYRDNKRFFASSCVLFFLGLGCSGEIGQGGRATSGSANQGSGGAGSSAAGLGARGGVGAQSCAFAPPRIWKLTSVQYGRVLGSVLPRAANPASDLAGTLAPHKGFSNAAGTLDMSEPHVGQLLTSVRGIATQAAATPAMLAPCLAVQPIDDACLTTFVGDFVGKAYRRDATPAEVRDLVAYARQQITATDTPTALRDLLTAILMSSNALYRTELGPDEVSTSPATIVALTPFERASALSFFLTDGPPDSELMAAARAGALERPTEIERHTRRLLADADHASGLLQFIGEQFTLRAAATAAKDAKVFPGWTGSLPQALVDESQRFVREVLWNGDASLATLLTADFSFMNDELSNFYGVPTPTSATPNAFAKTKLPAGQRAGLLTQGGILATLSKTNDTDAVRRGKFVRQAWLCQIPPPPPKNVNAVPPPPDGQHTQRERLAGHSKDATCAPCHRLMDPLGLAFEHYDGIGRYRATDVGQTLDTSGTLTDMDLEGERFNDAVELAALLAGSKDVRLCFATMAFQYAVGRQDEPLDACTLDRLSARFSQGRGDVIDLAVAIATDESFFKRQVGGP